MAQANDKQQRTVLITGGTGFIGSYFAMRLLEEDKSVGRVVLPDARLTSLLANPG